MNVIETLSVQEATEKLRAAGMKISAETLRRGLKDRRFPFGDYIPNGKTQGKTCTCIIYNRLLEQWMAERSVEQE